MSGDIYNLTGDFRGALVNIRSTLTHVQQSAGALPRGEDADREELQELVERLAAALEKSPPEGVEDAQAVATYADRLVEEAGREPPDRNLLRVTGSGLMEAAQAVVVTTPQVVELAQRIAATVARIGGG